MIGYNRAKRVIEDNVRKPVSSALVLSIFAVLLAGIAILMAVSK